MTDRVLCETLVASDLEAAVTAWRDDLGWEVTARGDTGADLARLWGVEAGRYPRFAVVASPGSERGFVRLVEGPEDDERGTFHHAGLFNAELLCADVDELHSRLVASARFSPVCPPTTYDLGSTGGAVSRSFATRGPGGAGVYFTTYVKVPPPRTLPPTPHLVCPMMNSALAVDDRGDAVDFFEDVLGIDRRFAGYFSEPNINRLLDLPPDGGFDMVVYKGEGDGLIEVDFYDDPLPRDAANGSTLQPGNSFLTLETADFDGVVARAAAAKPVALKLAGSTGFPPARLYAGHRAAMLRGPMGGRYEIIEGA